MTMWIDQGNSPLLWTGVFFVEIFTLLKLRVTGLSEMGRADASAGAEGPAINANKQGVLDTSTSRSKGRMYLSTSSSPFCPSHLEVAVANPIVPL